MPRTSSCRRIAAACIFVALVAVVPPALAQDKDTLWTKVSAAGSLVSLSWDKSHPWDTALRSAGAELIARYFVDARREVTESLGRGAARSGDSRTLQFNLPDTVRANPMGPVCLFLQLPDRRALPLRRRTALDADTVGFRYEPWERRIRGAAEVRSAQERVAASERALAGADRAIAGRETSLAKRGWTNVGSCEQIAGPSAALGPRPYDVVDPAAQDDVARRVCVNRVVVGYLVNQEYIGGALPKMLAGYAAAQDVEKAKDGLSAVYSSAFAGPPEMNPASLLNAVVGRLGADNGTVKARESQSAEFLRDWSRWTPTLSDYVPHLGSPNDDLGWPSTAAQSAFHLFGAQLATQLKAEWAVQGMPAGTVHDLEGFLGSALDAYSGCVDDSTKQLKTKYDNWEALRSSAPQRAASAREFLVRECRQEVGLVEKLKTERTTLQEQVARDRQALQLATAPGPIATRPVELNLVSCGPQPSQ